MQNLKKMKNKNIDTAVILAAGKGERISNTDEFVAKPLIKIFDVSLIERSIKNLINNLNIKKIYFLLICLEKEQEQWKMQKDIFKII